MSLWKKWEREKLEKMGIKVERESNVEIRDIRPKADVRQQAMIVGLAVVACLAMFFFLWALHDRYGGHWSEFPMIRSLKGVMEQRIEEGGIGSR